MEAETQAGRLGSDYLRVEQAIRYIEADVTEQPSLDQVAAVVGLSPHHFQRLFTRWAGVSPKRFLQYLTVERAKRLLEESWDLLSVSDEIGLSGPGRLHDHFVSLEAVTPGQFKSGGHGLTIEYGLGETPFGVALLAQSERGIVGLVFCDDPSGRSDIDSLRHDWPHADLRRDDRRIAASLARIFPARHRDALPIRLAVRGTNFQVSVWRALLQIPEGRLRSYGQIAEALGRPSAARAVSNAVAANPVAYLIPCHRVIRSLGEIGGYRWGSMRKRLIIGWETAHAEQGSAAGVPTTSTGGTPS